MTAPQNPRVTQEREWTRWSDQRPPNARGVYRYRASFDLLGLPVTAEWEEEMHLCGMGYSDSEWWPLSPCYWNGYRRYITNDTLEWSSVRSYDQPGVLWQGLDLLPCPFTGKAPTVSAQGKYIGAPLWQSEAVWIGSPAVPKRRFTNAKAMVAAWNTRHREAAEAASKGKIAALETEVEGLRFILQVVEDPDRQLCCSGYECGCMGSTVGQYAAWALSSEAASKAEAEWWRGAAKALAEREAEYRKAHDLHGDGSANAGRAWDLMRRQGDRIRAALTKEPDA